MLSARAYSFRQKSRLAISLSWVGGYTNVVIFLTCGTVVSHVTGTTTLLGKDLTEHAWGLAGLGAFLWLTFLLGAVSSALMTETAKRRGIASKYIPPMAVEALLLTVVAVGLALLGLSPARTLASDPDWHPVWRVCLSGIASFAMGLQNATITRISGAVVRTTHLTGVTTDLGLEGIQFLFWLRDRFRGRGWERAGRVMKVTTRHPDFLRVLLLASIFGSFLFGAITGTFMFIHRSNVALGLPVAFLLWIVYLDYRKPIADVREIDLLADSELKLAGIVKALLPPELGIWRISCKQHRTMHRAPDFQVWVEKVPHRWRVIILALSPLTRLDSNALLDMEAAVRKLRDEGRKLVLAGITQPQYRAVSDADVGRLIDPENLCPDLEFAIARGIDLVQAMRKHEPTIRTGA